MQYVDVNKLGDHLANERLLVESDGWLGRLWRLLHPVRRHQYFLDLRAWQWATSRTDWPSPGIHFWHGQPAQHGNRASLAPHHPTSTARNDQDVSRATPPASFHSTENPSGVAPDTPTT